MSAPREWRARNRTAPVASRLSDSSIDHGPKAAAIAALNRSTERGRRTDREQRRRRVHLHPTAPRRAMRLGLGEGAASGRPNVADQRKPPERILGRAPGRARPAVSALSRPGAPSPVTEGPMTLRFAFSSSDDMTNACRRARPHPNLPAIVRPTTSRCARRSLAGPRQRSRRLALTFGLRDIALDATPWLARNRWSRSLHLGSRAARPSGSGTLAIFLGSSKVSAQRSRICSRSPLRLMATAAALPRRKSIVPMDLHGRAKRQPIGQSRHGQRRSREVGEPGSRCRRVAIARRVVHVVADRHARARSVAMMRRPRDPSGTTHPQERPRDRDRGSRSRSAMGTPTA